MRPPGKPRREDAPRSIGDRLATAFLGVLAGALTLVGYALVVFFLVQPRGGPVLVSLIVSPIGLGYVAICGLAGAFLPGERFADFFSLLWGEHAFWDSRRGRWTAVFVALLLAAWLLLRPDQAGSP